MKIHFVTEGSLNGFWDKTEGIDCDVIVFGFNGLENVYYERELDGETGKLEDLAIMSPRTFRGGCERLLYIFVQPQAQERGRSRTRGAF